NQSCHVQPNAARRSLTAFGDCRFWRIRLKLTAENLMQRTFSRSLRMLCPILLWSAFGLATQQARAQANDNQVNDMTGSWLFTLTVSPPGFQFLALATFTKDGTFTGAAQGDGTCCPTEGPAHGVWAKTGPQTYSVRFYTLERNADGSLYGTFKVTMTLT